ncbi:hypothetical protein GCM10010383_70610 [Streptomyces lomondensis]|uniref:Uncharacterized protein n=1 Tax=Streptomyces lomondensis TaxID=68229 RepID=A0ABQ2XSH9_9ACTN|nr:hypothetical protein GCM10010383_70610 [Streptomyces lomondensis]
MRRAARGQPRLPASRAPDGYGRTPLTGPRGHARTPDTRVSPCPPVRPWSRKPEKDIR